MTPRRLALAAAGGVVAAVLAAAVDWGAMGRAVNTLVREPAPMAAALAVYTVAFVLRAVAWGPLLPAPVPLALRVRAIFASLAVNHALPGPVGEVARARMVTGPPAVTFRGALASVVAARVVDAASLAALVVAAAWAAGGAPGWLRAAAAAALALPGAALVVARRRGASITAGDAVRVAAWALPSWALEPAVLWAVAAAAGVDVSMAGLVLATCGGLLAQVAAVLPGGVGTYEAGVASVLVVLGVPAGEALAVAATTHAVKFLYSFALGLPALGWRRPSSVVVAAPVPA